MNVLVDTSVWSLALRRRPHHLNSVERAIVSELAELINEGRARIIGLVRQELLSGIRVPDQFAKLQEVLRSYADEPMGTGDYEAAAVAANKCIGKGLAVSVSDMLVCAVAQSRGWGIFSTDPDFRRYAEVLRLHLHVARK